MASFQITSCDSPTGSMGCSKPRRLCRCASGSPIPRWPVVPGSQPASARCSIALRYYPYSDRPAKERYCSSVVTGRGGYLHSHLSRCPTFVPMMKSSDLRQRDHRPKVRRLHRPTGGRVLLQRKVRPRLVIVLHERLHVSAQRFFVENDHVVEALAPNRPNHALDIGPLPGRTGIPRILTPKMEP